MSEDEKHVSIETTTTQPDVTEAEERELEEGATRKEEETMSHLKKDAEATMNLTECSQGPEKTWRRCQR